MTTDKKIEALLKANSGIRLDIGCGDNKKDPSWVGIDIRPGKQVDIVQDLEQFPWPLPDESVIVATAFHVIEHINPHKFIFVNFMNEVWRILKPGSTFLAVAPVAYSNGYAQDPTHVNMCNEATFHYFDPLSDSGLWNIYQPKPWKIEKWHLDERNGFFEVALSKRVEDKYASR